METADLRSLIKAAAIGTPGAKLWPNGLGFTCRGTEYTYSERTGDWWACRRIGDHHVQKCGAGSTPDAAKRAAGIGRPEHRIRGGAR